MERLAGWKPCDTADWEVCGTVRGGLTRFESHPAASTRHSDFVERAAPGRRVEIHVCGQFTIKYWDDADDRHLKILVFHLADRAV